MVRQLYSWDSLGQLTARVDAIGDGSGVEVHDSFHYDRLGRLTQYDVAGGSGATPATRSVLLAYNALGMLLYKSNVGNYSYPAQGLVNGRPHALQSVAGAHNAGYGYDLNGNATSATGGKWRNVAYTSFNLPDGSAGIQGPAGSPQASWQYDESHQRIKETRTNAQGARITWTLHPDNQGGLGFERELAPSGAQSNRHYLGAGGATFAVLVTTGALPTLQATDTQPPLLTSVVAVKLAYWHKDQLGSLIATTDHAGAVTDRYAYDPFGKRRYTNSSYDAFGSLVVDWTTDTNKGDDRGYTGHEHLDELGVIHMNGRIFDPLLGRFMQADPHIQDPLNLQNFDRYAYCYNNPLICTDPSGYFSLKRSLKKVWHNKFFRTAIIVAAAYVTGGYALEAYASAVGQTATAGFMAAVGTNTAIAVELEAAAVYTSASAAAAASVTGGAIYGAAGGFAAAFVGSNGNLKAGIQGAVTGGVLGAVGSATAGWQPAARVAAKVGTSATLARIQGGDFSDAALYSLKTNLASETFRAFVGWSASPASGQNQTEGVTYSCGETGSNCYYRDASNGNRIPLLWKDTNVVGRDFALQVEGESDFWKQGGPVSQALNLVPGLNAVAQLHDTLFLRTSLDFNLLTNVGTMLPAAYLTYGALLNTLPADKRLCPRCGP